MRAWGCESRGDELSVLNYSLRLISDLTLSRAASALATAKHSTASVTRHAQLLSLTSTTLLVFLTTSQLLGFALLCRHILCEKKPAGLLGKLK